MSLGHHEVHLLGREGLGMVFQDPAGALNPVMRVGDQIVEAILARGDSQKRAAVAEALALLGRMGIPDPRGALRCLPARVLGRPAAASRHRRRAGRRHDPPARRRADQRARRPHPGPDPRAHPRPQPPGSRRAARVTRLRRGRADLQPRAGPLRRADLRDRDDPGSPGAAAPSLHQGASRGAARHRPCPSTPRRDPRPATRWWACRCRAARSTPAASTPSSAARAPTYP